MNNIKKIRTSLGMRQADLAEKLNIKQNTLSYWETGRYQPDNDALVRIAGIFGVTVDYLLGNDTKIPSDIIRIPVLGSVPAGIPLEAIEDIIDWEDIPQAMTAGGREYFALQVNGDSMWPDYLPGDIVIVRKSSTCKTGDDCVVYVNGYDATLKQVRLDDDARTMTIVPRNNNYPPRTFTADEILDLPVTIAGIVVELRRKIQK